MEKMIKLYEKQIEMLLQLYDIVINGNGIKLKDVSPNAAEEIKCIYKHYISSGDDKLLDIAIENLLPNLYLQLDNDEINKIKSIQAEN